MLEALRRGDELRYVEEHPDAMFQPYPFLWSALYCGGRITPATVLGLRYLVEAVTADDFGGADRTLRVAAVWWIRDVARAAVVGKDAPRLAEEPSVEAWLDDYLRDERSIFEWGDDDEPGRVLLAAARADCFDFLPECFAPLSGLLTPGQPAELRAAAASAAAASTGHPALRDQREWIAAYHAEQARHGSSHHRASMVLGLGELDTPTTEWLGDPELGVRVCAALAPALAGDEAAIEVLRGASLDPAGLGQAFGDMRLHQVPQLDVAVREALLHGTGPSCSAQ